MLRIDVCSNCLFLDIGLLCGAFTSSKSIHLSAINMTISMPPYLTPEFNVVTKKNPPINNADKYHIHTSHLWRHRNNSGNSQEHIASGATHIFREEVSKFVFQENCDVTSGMGTSALKNNIIVSAKLSKSTCRLASDADGWSLGGIIE